MVGQGSPIGWGLAPSLKLGRFHLVLLMRALVVLLSLGGVSPSFCPAAEDTVRLRLAWGGGDGAKHRWFGRITCADATFSELQPLGIESDAPAALRLHGRDILADPLEKRGFDGCDVTLEGNLDAVLHVELQSDQASSTTTLEIPVVDIVEGQVREPLDSTGSFLLAYRSPGDRLRALLDRDNMIFHPGETWLLKLRNDFAVELAAGPVIVEADLRSAEQEVVWHATQTLHATSGSDETINFEITCPIASGDYRLTLEAHPEEGLATRFVPGQRPQPFATREIDMVVIDPEQRLPPLTDHWVSILSIDPANSSWWQRLPSWAQVPRLSGRTSGSLGNVRLSTHTGANRGLVELPPSTNPDDPAWQAFTLPILEVGTPHLVEVTYPLAVRQRISISIVEPDAAGRIMHPVPTSGICVEEVFDASNTELGKHQILFWPRTRSPQLLLVNRHPELPGVFGSIELYHHNGATSTPVRAMEDNDGAPLFAEYLARPELARNFGAAEVLDSASGMSVQSWSTFHTACQRLIQHLKLSGYNAAIVSVAADGSALYPSEVFIPSPQFDTGMLAASGQDPVRKDVLELLCRMCDAEHVRLIPTLQLGMALPKLENLRLDEDPRVSGLTLVSAAGQELRGAPHEESPAQFGYNLLNPRVQAEILAAIDEVVRRCEKHDSFAGIGLQIEGTGYGILPGLNCGFDDQTTSDFCRDSGVSLPTQGEDRFRQRAELLLGNHRQAWQAWRANRVAQFYARVAKHLGEQRPEAQLFLLAENLFNTSQAQQTVRRNMALHGSVESVYLEHGIDLEKLASIPSLRFPNAIHESPQGNLPEQAANLLLNEVAQRMDLENQGLSPTSFVIHSVEPAQLTSFDRVSPFGSEATHLVLAQQPLPAGGSRRRAWLGSLATGSLSGLIEGGEYLPLAVDIDKRRMLRALQSLPAEYSESRPIEKQPLTVRILRTPDATYLVGLNQSPWWVSAQITCETSEATDWQELGDVDSSPQAAQPDQSGSLPEGQTLWPIKVAPFTVRLWKFGSPQLQVSDLVILDDWQVYQFLANKIAEIESRAANLNIVRSYQQLQNPGFELQEGVARIFGWQIRKASLGSARIETEQTHSGLRVLRLQSADATGVAVQSHLFPQPRTGLLIVGAYLCVNQAADDARLVMAVESEDEGRTYRQYRVLTGQDLPQQCWVRRELILNDLPAGDDVQIRVQFHAVGALDLLVDDVDLCDLRFDDQQRREYIRRVFAAKTALEDHQVVDCLRLLDEYWSRYLVEYVPPEEREPVTLAKQPPRPVDETPSVRHKMGERLRGLVPKLWR